MTAGAPEIPQKLVEQLKVGGIMVAPVDSPDGRGQSLVRIVRTEDGFEQEDLLPVRFVPLVEGIARES